MTKTQSEALETITKVIDEQCAPERMSKGEYEQLLDELAGDIESRLVAVQEELEAEQDIDDEEE